MVLYIFLTARKIYYEQSRREEAWTITIILIFIGISIQIISTTSGAVFNAFLLAVASAIMPIQLFSESLAL